LSVIFQFIIDLLKYGQGIGLNALQFCAGVRNLFLAGLCVSQAKSEALFYYVGEIDVVAADGEHHQVRVR